MVSLWKFLGLYTQRQVEVLKKEAKREGILEGGKKKLDQLVDAKIEEREILAISKGFQQGKIWQENKTHARLSKFEKNSLQVRNAKKMLRQAGIKEKIPLIEL